MADAPSSLSEFEERYAMESLGNLLKSAYKNPKGTLKLLNKVAQHEEAYPIHYSMIYLLGILHGILFARTNTAPTEEIMKGFEIINKNALHCKPSDYLGARRKYGKTGVPVNPTK